MEESLKYFVPEISDIRVGYECRRVNTFFLPNEWGEEHTLLPLKSLTKQDISDLFRTSWSVRVPYLTPKQIQEEGWEYERINLYMKTVGDKKYSLYTLDNNEVLINRETNFHILFKGKCKCINEFRTITKLLGI